MGHFIMDQGSNTTVHVVSNDVSIIAIDVDSLPVAPTQPRRIENGKIQTISTDYIKWDYTTPCSYTVLYTTNLVTGEWEIVSSNSWGRFHHYNPEGFYKVISNEDWQ